MGSFDTTNYIAIYYIVKLFLSNLQKNVNHAIILFMIYGAIEYNIRDHYYSQVNNPEDHTVLAFSSIINTDSTFQDSTTLFDDGLHGDSLAGDMIFSGTFAPLTMEDNFTLSLRTLDVNSNYHHTFDNANYLTTIGPVVLDSYTIISSDTIPNPGDAIRFKINLKNYGNVKTAKDISKFGFKDENKGPCGGSDRSKGICT